METLELVTLLILPAALLLDLVHRAKPYRRARFWRLRAGVVTVGAVLGAGWIAAFWGGVYGDAHLFDLSGANVWLAAGVGILVYELGHYWYHRAAHGSDRLWRFSHQFHHSAESLDAWGANYLSPIDLVAFTTISSLVFFPLLGLSVEAAVIATFFLAFNAVFQHTNVRTPRWLGYFVQRPESHSLHHARGVHRHNYSDLPLWDMLFGTFANPRDFRAECGFEPGASARIPEMLIGRDVSDDPEYAPASPRADLPAARQVA